MPTWRAILLLERGRKIRRTSWEEKNDYIYLDEKGSLRHSSGRRYRLEHKFNVENWEVYKD